MKRVIAFGAGRNLSEWIAAGYDCKIVAVADNDVNKQNKYTDEINVCSLHLKIISPIETKNFDYDHVLVMPRIVTGIVKQLVSIGVEPNDISFYDADFEIHKEMTKSGELIAHVGQISLLWKHEIEEGITHEIFVNKVYNYGGLNGRQVVVDIGMNVGIASLYFAQRKNVDCVYGFEPFIGTYNRAIENINLNTDYIKEKIRTYNFGLGSADETIEAV